MNSTKIQCSNCGARFFTLNREEIDCNCGLTIIVKEQLKTNHTNKVTKKPSEEDLLIDEVDNSLLEVDDIL